MFISVLLKKRKRCHNILNNKKKGKILQLT